MKCKKPDKDQLIEMLNMIVGSETEAVELKAIDAVSIDFTARYIDDDGGHVASCACSLATAAGLGCALSMIPPGGAEGMVEDKELTKTANENLYEVMNIFSSVLMSDKSVHLKLAEVLLGGDSRMQGDGIEQEAFTIKIGKYGAGELVFNFA